MAQLKAGIALKAFVRRNGKEYAIEARELVAGDIVSPSDISIVLHLVMLTIKF